jgi:hypothetical protein
MKLSGIEDLDRLQQSRTMNSEWTVFASETKWSAATQKIDMKRTRYGVVVSWVATSRFVLLSMTRLLLDMSRIANLNSVWF